MTHNKKAFSRLPRRLVIVSCVLLLVLIIAIGVGTPLASAQSADGNWSKFQNDTRNTGQNPTVNGPDGYIENQWTASIGGNLDMSPTIKDGVVYAGGGLSNSSVYAVNTTDGTIIWQFSTGNDVQSSPAVVNGTVYVGSNDDKIYALNASSQSMKATQREKWSVALDRDIRTSPTVTNGTVYVQSDISTFALNATDGSERWNRSIGSQARAAPAVQNETVYVSSGFSGNLYALNQTDGTTRWSFSTGGGTFSAPTVVNGTVYLGSWDNNFYAVNASTGNEQWNVSTGDNIYSSAAIANGTAYFGSEDGYLYAVNTSDGSLRWKYQTSTSIRGSPSVANGTVYFGSMFGSGEDRAYAFGIDGEFKWKYNPGGEVQGSVVVWNGTAYVPSRANGLHAVAANETQRSACSEGASVSEVKAPEVGVTGQSTTFPVNITNTAGADCPVSLTLEFNQTLTTASTTVPANDSQYVYVSRTFLQNKTYNGTVAGTDVSVDVIDPVVKHSSITRVSGPQSTTPRISASLNSFGIVSVNLNCASEGSTSPAFNLSNCGANTSTVYEINLTLENENFTPRVLVSTGQDLNWTIDNGSTTLANRTNVSVRARPSELQYTSNATRLDDFETLSDQEDQADFNLDAAILMGISNGESRFFSSNAKNLTNMTISTNAQNFRPPRYYASTNSQQSRLEIKLAGPHLTTSGAVNDGFYEVFIPDSQLAAWDVDDPAELEADWSEETDTDLTVTKVSDGMRLNLTLSYSSGTATISPDTTAPTAAAGTDRTITEGEDVTVDGSGSTDNRQIETHQWDLDDGTTATGQSTTHTYPTTGTYTVTLTVTDAAGNTDSDTLTVTVESATSNTDSSSDDDTASSTATPTPTPTPVPTPTVSATPTAAPTQTPDSRPMSTPDQVTETPTATPEATNTPNSTQTVESASGFGIIVTLISLSAVLLLRQGD
jgi:outer membrane protein assembly factor BamB